MRRDRAVGLALIVLGGVFIAMGYRTAPPRMLSVIAGIVFIIAGLVRVLRGRR